MKTIFQNKATLSILGLLIGLFAGWIFFHKNPDKIKSAQQESKEESKETIWTCAMHPQIRRNEPGNCPICGMELIPVSEYSAGPNVVEMSEEAARLANIQTTAVGFTLPQKEIYLQGKVKVDERRVSNQTSHIPGRIEKLYISFTGETVHAGDRLASVYSPEVVTAQKELLEAAKTRESNPLLYNAARNKLKQWKLSESQIDGIERAGKVEEVVDIRADIGGVVLKRNVSVGDHMKEGAVLFTIADLRSVWLEFDAYEADIPWLKVGDEITFTVSSLPGVKFREKVSFIDPIINPQTRTASVRLEVNNKDRKLKPEMFASGTITANLPIREAHLTVPKSAVLWTGKRSVVYVAVPNSDKPMFEFREVTLGHDLGGYFIVEEGLKDGERVVTNGTFKVDAAAQLAGKKSMMNREGEQVMPAHQHGKADDMLRSTQKMQGMEEATFGVSGNCDMCKSRIEKAALSVSGVLMATWDKNTKKLTAHFDGKKTNKEAIAKAIAEAGHDTELQKASKGTYQDLPECCQYTRHHD